jgi:NADPH:quinone reductase
MRAIVINEFGGPEVLRLTEAEIPEPAPGEILVRHRAIGLNFADTYLRAGVYPMPLPSGIGAEAAGVVEAVGPGTSRFAPGDRVAYCLGPFGAYADCNWVPASRAVRVPEAISEEVAAASLMKGLAARYLLKSVRLNRSGDTVLWHAAAGGVGLIALQWARLLGLRVIAVVGSEAKGEIARAHGAAHVILSNADIAAEVRALTGGEGVPVVYDSVGHDTFEASLNSLAPTGLLVNCGNASGPTPDIKARDLAQKGSLFFTRPALATYVRTEALLDEAAADLFAVLASGAVKVEVRQRWPLEAAAQAHRALEARQTVGSSLLIP